MSQLIAQGFKASNAVDFYLNNLKDNLKKSISENPVILFIHMFIFIFFARELEILSLR